jgi:rare lipoprotein A (peptidoglycan hydrolase)
MKDWQLLLILIMLWIANDHLQDISRKMDTQVGLAEQQVEQLKKDIFVLQEQEKEIDEANKYKWIGTASYYSEDGCLGCSPTLRMANGETFKDTGYTIAFNWLPMNTWVQVTNSDTGDTTYARVTDTGGVNKLGRIADLSPAVKDAINCSSLCKVKVERVTQ